MMPVMSVSGFWESLLFVAVFVGYPLAFPVALGLTVRSAERRWRHTCDLPPNQRLGTALVATSVILSGALASTVNTWAAVLTVAIIINAWAVLDAAIGCATSPTLRSERATLIGTRLTLALWLMSPFMMTRALFFVAIGITVGSIIRRIAGKWLRDLSTAAAALGALVAGFTTDLIARSDRGFLRLWKDMPLTTIGITAAAAIAVTLYTGLAERAATTQLRS